MPWAPKFRNTKTKTLKIRSNAEAGVWTGIVAQSVDIFNEKIMKAMRYELVTEGGAQVVVKIAGSSKNDPKLGTSSVHGKTFKGRGEGMGKDMNGVIEAEIFLPSDPSQTHTNVLLLILMHEMAHAAGLEEHANDGIFMTVPNIDQNGIITATRNSKKMPPFFFSNKTVTRMRAIW